MTQHCRLRVIEDKHHVPVAGHVRAGRDVRERGKTERQVTLVLLHAETAFLEMERRADFAGADKPHLLLLLHIPQDDALAGDGVSSEVGAICADSELRIPHLHAADAVLLDTRLGDDDVPANQERHNLPILGRHGEPGGLGPHNLGLERLELPRSILADLLFGFLRLLLEGLTLRDSGILGGDRATAAAQNQDQGQHRRTIHPTHDTHSLYQRNTIVHRISTPVAFRNDDVRDRDS